MITSVLSTKDQICDKKKLYEQLVAQNPDDKYKKQKAAGAIGGAVAHGFIVGEGEYYRCTRDAKK